MVAGLWQARGSGGAPCNGRRADRCMRLLGLVNSAVLAVVTSLFLPAIPFMERALFQMEMRAEGSCRVEALSLPPQ